MRLFRTLNATAAALMVMAVTASPAAAAQTPTYDFHKQVLWASYGSGETRTCFRLPAVVKTKNNVLLASPRSAS